MWETINTAAGFTAAAITLKDAWQKAQTEQARREIKRELGLGVGYCSSLPLSRNLENWDRYIRRNGELAAEFDNAATAKQYINVFKRLGFIDEQPSEEQIQIIRQLVQINLDEGAKAVQVLASKTEDIAEGVDILLALGAGPTALVLKQSLDAATDRYLQNTGRFDDEHAGFPWQTRPELEAIAAFLETPQEQRMLVLTGSAGMGKSDVAAQMVKHARSQAWPVLAFRLDMLSPTDNPRQLGTSLDLPDSPAKILAQVAEGGNCLLVIDQLDAVSQASGRHPAFYNVVDALLMETGQYPKMRVLLSCREFDLANDDRFQRLVRGKQPPARQQSLALLSAEQVGAALEGLGCSPDRLTDKQRDMLRLPLHLKLFAEGWTQAAQIQAVSFQSINDLYKLFTTRKEQVLRQKDPRFSLSQTLAPLVQRMNDEMALSVPEAALDDLPLKSELFSEGILRKQGGRVNFFHEGYFDYLFARRFIAAGEDLLSVLLRSEQHLFRRAQVRQILTFLREQDLSAYVRSVQDVLTSPDIRFHLKELVYSLLWQWPNPLEDEWLILQQGLQSGDPAAVEFSGILTGSLDWGRFLLDRGVLAAWFESTDPAEHQLAANILNVLVHSDSDKYLEFVRPYLGRSQEMDTRIAGSLGWRLDVDSHEFVEFILELFRQTLIDEHKIWLFLEELSKSQPTWAIEGVVTVLQLLIERPLSEQDGNRYMGRSDDFIKDEWHASKIFERCSIGSPKLFVEMLLPKLLELAEKYAYAEQLDYRFKKDMIWSYRLDWGMDRAGDALLRRLISALGQLTPEEFQPYATTLRGSDLEVAQYMLLKAYILRAPACADEAIQILCEEPERLQISENGSVTQLSFKLLRATTLSASPETLNRLEYLLINYTTHWEKSKEAFRFRGHNEYRLLAGIDPTVRSEKVQRRFAELSRKFPDENPEVTRRTHWAGVVGSPIVDRAVPHMTDQQWLTAMCKYDSDGIETHRHTDDGGITGGAGSLAQTFGAEAKKDPERFAKLALTLPDDLHPVYFTHLVMDLHGVDLDPGLTLNLARRCHALPGRPCGRYIPDLFGRRPTVDWPDEALQLVADYALNDPDPTEDTWIAGNGFRDPDSQGINSVRGRAAEALGQLLLAEPKRFGIFRPSIEKLIQDPIVAVRACAAHAVVATLNVDAELAVDWFLKLADTRDEFLSARHASEFMRYALNRHFDRLRPVLERMLNSENEDVSHEGAILVCLASFSCAEARPLAEKARSGSTAQRQGAAKVYSFNVAALDCRDQCLAALPFLFNDSEATVREEASHFPSRLGVEDFPAYRELISQFIGSPAFLEQPFPMLNQLGQSILRLPDTLLDAAEAYLLHREHLDLGHGNRERTYIREFSKLLFSLYTQHLNRTMPDTTILNRSLDLFDQLARLRDYAYSEGMQQVER